MALVIMALLYVAGIGYAQTMLIGPERCPVPADAPAFNPAGDVDAGDLNPWREAAADAVPIVETGVAKNKNADRAYVWLDADPASGEVFAPRPRACKD